MDSLCLKAGIHGLQPPTAVSGTGCLEVRTCTTHPSQLCSNAVGRSSAAISSVVSYSQPWGFSFRYPLRSLWPNGGKNTYDAAIAVKDAVLVEDEDEKQDGLDNEGRDGNWVLNILHVRSLWKQEQQQREKEERMRAQVDEEKSENGGVSIDDEKRSKCCDVCTVCDDDEKIDFDRDSFTKLLRRVSLAEARLYARLSYLGNLAYSIPQIKPGNLLRNHGLRFVTSSVERKEQALRADKEKALAEDQQKEEKAASENQHGKQNESSKDRQMEDKSVEGDMVEQPQVEEVKIDGNRINAAAAFQIAASYLHSQTKSILPFITKSRKNDDLPKSTNGVNMMNEEVASVMATTDSVTAVVAAKEEVKQAVADNLNSTHSSPCEWFICDDDQSATRFFVIQGSESLASWQANLLFEPVQFEGNDVLVHRGIYEAAKGIYEQVLPEVRSHLKSYSKRATFRFTGHSLGGSLSLLINLMLLIRGEVPASSLLPVITFGAPTVMCGGDRLLGNLGLPRSHVRAITMHRDIVPRAFSCCYPDHVARFLKAVNGNFRTLPCLANQKLLYGPMGEFLILQPDEKFSPSHHLLPSGSGLYLLSCPAADASEAERQMQAAKAVFLNSPHPLEILSDRAAYGSGGTIQRDHDMNSYLRCVRNVIRQELSRTRKAKREHRRKVWWPLVASRVVNPGGIIIGNPMPSITMVQLQFKFAGIIHTGKESLIRFGRLVVSHHHMNLLVVVVMFPARLLILGAHSLISSH